MPKPLVRIFLIFAVFVAVLLLIYAFASRTGKVFTVSTAVVRVGDLEEIVEMSGNVDAEESETVIANAGGIVADLRVDEGDRVVRGRRLCWIRSPELRAKLLEMKAELVTAQENLAAAESEADRAMARARHDFIRANIVDIEDSVRPAAHIAGDVIQVDVQNGSAVTAGTKMFFLADMEQPLIKARMDEADVQKVKEGQPVWITGDFLGGKSLQGKVYKISKFVDKQVGSYVETLCRIFNPNGLPVKFGAYADVKVITSRKKAVLMAPREALILDEGAYVFLVRGNRAYITPIVSGIMGDKYVEVRAGLKAGDRVVTTGSLEIKNGDRIAFQD